MPPQKQKEAHIGDKPIGLSFRYGDKVSTANHLVEARESHDDREESVLQKLMTILDPRWSGISNRQR